MEELINVISKLTRIPQSFEVMMLEVGSKTDIIHDLSVFELAIKYAQQKDNLECLLNDSNHIKTKEQKEFLQYITESPDGKTTKILSKENELN